jgi:hypothetical protein
LSDERKVRHEDRHRKSNATEQTRSENMTPTQIQRQFANAQSNGMKHINVMPNGLPINSPATMPMLFAEASSDPPADAAQ